MEVIPRDVVVSEKDFDDILAKDLRQLSVEERDEEEPTAAQKMKSAINQATISTGSYKSQSNKLKTNFFKMLNAMKVPAATTTSTTTPNSSPTPTPLLPRKGIRRQSSTGEVSKRRKSLYTDLASTPDSVGSRVALPKTFRIKYLGRQSVDALWGVKHTRKVVDSLLTKCRASGRRTPILMMTVSEDGLTLSNAAAITSPDKEGACAHFPINTVSYGVQDFVYTKIFSLITVCRPDEENSEHDIIQPERDGPFSCYVFYCATHEQVVDVTAALAEAFKRFTRLLEQPESPRHVPLDHVAADGHSEV